MGTLQREKARYSKKTAGSTAFAEGRAQHKQMKSSMKSSEKRKKDRIFRCMTLKTTII